METQYFWSPSTNGFVVSDINEIPADALSITAERWQELLTAQGEGNRIVTGSDGYPTLEAVPDAPPQTPAQKLESLGLTTDDLKALLGL